MVIDQQRIIIRAVTQCLLPDWLPSGGRWRAFCDPVTPAATVQITPLTHQGRLKAARPPCATLPRAEIASVTVWGNIRSYCR